MPRNDNGTTWKCMPDNIMLAAMAPPALTVSVVSRIDARAYWRIGGSAARLISRARGALRQAGAFSLGKINQST